MYPFFAEKIIYPLSDIALGTSVIKYYHWLQKTQWWSPEQLQELQNTKLRALIKHAFNNVTYYQKIFEERGLTDKDFHSVEDLSKLPILTKADIRKNSQSILAKDFKRWKPILNSSGGSTGEPLKYYITKDLASISWAGKFRGYGWAGYRIGDKRVSYGGSSLIPNKKPTLFVRTRRKLERNLQLSSASMNDSRYKQYVDIILKYKPKYLSGYASSLYELANYCRENKVDRLKFNAVFSTAVLLLPTWRDRIQKQFDCEVYDQYGAYDGGGQALECHTHKGFHISVEKVVMEVLDERGQKLPYDKPGRIIVTDLYNYAMPFIRYEVGDIGALDDRPCECGRGLPLLQSLDGRSLDSIKLSNGNIIDVFILPELIKDCHVKQYQLVQTAPDELLVRIIKDTGYTEPETDYFMRVLRHHAGNGVKIKLEFCDKIPEMSNSKYRFIISET